MINDRFVILGAIIGLIGALSYLIDTVKGKVKPNRVTFFLWALAPLIAFAAEIKQGVGIQALMTFMVGFIPLIIFIASFVNKKSYWKLGWFDFLCGALSLIGLSLWYVTKNGNHAIMFSILADVLASLPTFVKSYYYPKTESAFPYLFGVINALIVLLTIKTWNLANYGFPIETVLINSIIFTLVRFELSKKNQKRF